MPEQNNFFQSGVFKGVVFFLVMFIVFLFGFKVGSFVGIRRADFSNRWLENYPQNFGGGMMRGFFRGIGDRDFLGGHGLSGQILKIDGADITVKGRDNIEKIVTVNDSTQIREMMSNVKISDLEVGDFIVVIGQPNTSGQVEANFIRVMPYSVSGMMGQNTPVPSASPLE